MEKINKKKKGSIHLFQLVKSLTKSEKRYFKIYLKRNALGENSISEKLFDAIDKQVKYNEQTIKETFKEESFTRNLSVAKNRLTENILKSLHFFHNEKADNNKFYSLLNEIELLYKRSLNELCAKRILKAKELALKREDSIKILLISEWEEKLGLHSVSSDLFNNALLSIKLNAEISNLKKSVLTFPLKKAAQEKIKNRLIEIINKEGLEQKTHQSAHNALSALFFIQKDYKNAISHSQTSLKFVHDDDHQERIALLGNIIYLAVQLKQFDKAKTHLFNLRMIGKEFGHIPALNVKLFENISSLDLLIKSSENRIQDAIEKIPQIATKLMSYNGEVAHSTRASFYLNFSHLYFLKSNFKESLKWNNELLNYSGINKVSEIYTHAKMFNIIIHYELGHSGLINSELNALKRFLTKSNSLGPFEELFLRQFSSRIDFSQWESEFRALESQEKNKSLARNFDFEKWLQSKAKNIELIYLI